MQILLALLVLIPFIALSVALGIVIAAAGLLLAARMKGND